MKGARGAKISQGAAASSWVIVEEADQELRPLSESELDWAAYVFGGEAAKEMAEFSEELTGGPERVITVPFRSQAQ